MRKSRRWGRARREGAVVGGPGQSVEAEVEVWMEAEEEEGEGRGRTDPARNRFPSPVAFTFRLKNTNMFNRKVC